MLSVANRFRFNHAVGIIHQASKSSRPWLMFSMKDATRRKHHITFRPYVPHCHTDHDHKNMALKRPMSPHMFIYVPTMPAMTSILQRITGIIVTGYALLLAGGTLFLANGVETYVSVIQSLDLSRSTTFVIKVLLGAPFAFHYFNGIRFCAWNAGRWLSMKQVTSSAHQSWIATLALMLLFAIL